MRYIFNPEHDLCLANGSPTFIPPESALRFGRDCSDILAIVLGQPEEGQYIIPWGWDNVLKYRLSKAGTPESLLPSTGTLEEIRRLSHRRTSLLAGCYIRKLLQDNALSEFLTTGTPEELRSLEMAGAFLERHPNAVFKAPWSGSGKGLRWIRRNEFSHSDEGWCRNVIEKQGSVIAEPREDVVRDFAMLFRATRSGIVFEGYSLFHTDNGAYRSNVLASDSSILAHLSRIVPEEVLTAVRKHLTSFLEDHFTGKYEGYLGADMFICRDNSDGTVRYRLNPCVEINVRMTMGLLARKYFDRGLLPDRSATYLFSVLYSPNPDTLRQELSSALRILTPISPTTRYAVAILPSDAPILF